MVLGVRGSAGFSTVDGDHAVFRLRDHTRRLFRSARMLNIELPLARTRVNTAQMEVIGANGLGACYLRPLVYLGGERAGARAKGNSVHLAIAAWVWDDYLGKHSKNEGIRIKTSSFTRPAGNSVMMTAKASGNDIISTLAYD